MKKILVLLLALALVLGLVACGGDGASTDTGSSAPSSDASVNATSDKVSDTASSGSSDSEEDSKIEEDFPNLVLAIDQIKERAVVYDLDAFEEGDNLEDVEVWSVKTGHAAGLKYREDTVFGDVVLIGGSKSAIYEYPSGREIWSTDKPGNNTHSVEILPSGNIVLANSTGSCLRLFYTSALLKGDAAGAQKFKDYELKGAHGVLWDPEYDVLWGLGGYELVAYTVTGSGTSEKLSKVGGMGCSLEGLGYGHDLQPDYTDSRYLYFTAGNVFRFDKDENEAGGFAHSTKMQIGEIKGFSNNPSNHFFRTGDLGGEGKFFADSTKESWLTDTIVHFEIVERKGKTLLETKEYVATESAFYKIRSFCGRYQ